MDSKYILSWIAGLLCSFSCLAAPLTPNEREITQQRQAELLELNEQQRLSLQRSTSVDSTALSSSAPGGNCIRINTIILTGASHLPTDVEQKIYADWQHRCLFLRDLFQLRDAISAWYLNAGFITSQAFILPQDLAGGSLTVTVIEGKRQEIRVNQQQNPAINALFPRHPDGLLNLWDIEQGLEQINRVRRQSATIDILPADTPAGSVVNLVMPAEFPLMFNFSAENSGQKSTCADRLNGRIQANNLLGIADQWYMAGGGCNGMSAHTGDSRSFQSGVSLVYGYWSGDYSYSWSDYLSPFRQQSFDWRYHGSSEYHQLRLSRILQRDGDGKSGLSLALARQKNSNYLNTLRLAGSSYSLTSFSAQLSHSQKWLAGYGTLNVSWQRGLPFSDVPAAGSSSRFNKLGFSASYYRPLPASWYWLSSLYGQWSDRRLFGSERLTLGGESSVRGFKEQYIAGERGGYWRNEVGRRLTSLPLAGSLSLHLALDAGRIFPDAHDRFSGGNLAGASLAIDSRSQRVFSELAIGRSLVWPQWMEPDRMTVWYRIGVML